MPVLAVFSWGFLVGLLVFHQQAQLPNPAGLVSLALATLGPVPSTAILLIFACLTCLHLCKRLQQGLPEKAAGAASLCTGAATALAYTLLLTSHHQGQQVQLACKGQQVNGVFTLREVAFKPAEQASWLIQVKQANTPGRTPDDTPCLRAGQLLLVQSNSDTNQLASADDNLKPLLPGDSFQAQLVLKPPKAGLQLHGFDVQRYWFAQGVAGLGSMASPAEAVQAFNPSPLAWLERVRLHTASWIVKTLAGHPEQALVLALVVGDQGLISPQDRALFNSTGIAHLVAISGLHITLFAWASGLLVQRLWRLRPSLCERLPAQLAGAVAGLLLALLYALVAGWGVPAQRTVFMLGANLVIRVRGGTYNAWDSFHLALLLSALLDPFCVFDAGFLLSFGAVGALVLANQNLVHIQTSRFPALRSALRAQWVCTVALLVPCAALFLQQSLVSPLANALSIPWMSFLSTPATLMGAALRQGWLLGLGADSLAVQRIWLSYLGQLPWAVLPLAGQSVWVYALATLGCIGLLTPRGLVPRLPCLALVGLLFLPPTRPGEGEFWLTALDVGQGTAVAVQTRQHVLVYDSGPAFTEQSNTGRRVIAPWLAHQGHRRLDALWISHDDADHTGGAAHLIYTTPPAILASPMQAPHPLLQAVQAQGGHTDNCHNMAPWEWDGVRFEPLQVPTHSSTSKNDQSCVLRIHNGQFSALLTGDIELQAELGLLATHANHKLRADWLLVPHHGSKTSSSPPFLKAVAPQLAVVQAGWGNRYGHPHPIVQQRYSDLGIAVQSTAQNGAMQWRFSQGSAFPATVSAFQARASYWHLHESGAHSVIR